MKVKDRDERPKINRKRTAIFSVKRNSAEKLRETRNRAGTFGEEEKQGLKFQSQSKTGLRNKKLVETILQY